MSTPLERLQEAATRLRISKQNFAYKTAVEAINNPGTPIICGKNKGRGRFNTSESWQTRTVILLKSAGITVEAFNVAPQGGKHGDRIAVYL